MEDRVLQGRYRLLSHLARGGMADVWEAEDTLLNRRVAVKILHPNFAGDEAFVTRFRREAQAAANLSHPNIVAIYDWGQEDDTYFMVMELIQGRTLREILKSEGALLARRAAEIASEAGAALTVAHQAGVFHRDIKPGNIMITGDGGVKVTDFGIARALDDSEELTRTGAVIGTATYFSPEQAQGLPADGRSDVYSLGVVLYEMLAGKPPFTGESPVAVAYQHVSEYALPPDQVNPDVPSDLAAVVERAMAKGPAERYQTADAMREDLLLYLAGRQPVAAGALAAAAATALITTPPATVPPDETARVVSYQPTEERSQATYAAAVIGLLVVLGVGIFILWRLLAGGSPIAETVAVPDVSNKPAVEAFEELQALDLKVKPISENSVTIPPDVVIRTDPPAGTDVDKGSTVDVYVSAGVEEFNVPNVTGETEADARRRIEEQGFTVGVVTYEVTVETEAGIVTDQSPEGGTTQAPGTPVDLTVSSGPSTLVVPDVTGLSAENAVIQLQRDGFTNIAEEEEFSFEVLPGFVIRTEPRAGEVVPAEVTLRVYVSKGPEPVDVPNIVGQSTGQAEVELNTLGLILTVSSETVEVALDSGLIGNIAEQSPGAGETVDVGTEVVVKLGVVRKVIVPMVVGLTEQQAQEAANAAGLSFVVLGAPNPAPTPEEEGLVDAQLPDAGTEVDEGTVLEVTVYGEPLPPPTTTTTVPTTTTTAAS